ncbi:MAG: class I SAM-dependent methyltransferase [Candidatus Xenobia bacterium]
MDAESWNRRYEERPRLWVARPDPAVVELVAANPPGTLVDLASGEGRNSIYLAEHGWRVTAVDFASVALARLRQEAASRGVQVETVESDLLAYLAAPLQFDWVLLAFMHPPAAQRAELLRRIHQQMRAGAHLLLVLHHRDSLGITGPPDPSRLVGEDDLRQPLEGLELDSMTVRPDPTDAGPAAPTLVAIWHKPA